MPVPNDDVLNLDDLLGPDNGNTPSFVYFQVSGETATLFADTGAHAASGAGGTALLQFTVAAGTSPSDLLSALFSNQQIVI